MLLICSTNTSNIYDYKFKENICLNTYESDSIASFSKPQEITCPGKSEYCYQLYPMTQKQS